MPHHRNRSFLKLSKMILKTPNLIVTEAKIHPRRKAANPDQSNPARRTDSSQRHVGTTRNVVEPMDISSPLATPDPVSLLRLEDLHANTSQQSRGVHKSAIAEHNKVQPSLDPMLELENQRRDIDRIFEAINSLQAGLSSVKECIGNIQVDGHAREIELLTENVAKVSKSVGEVEGLKFEMKMMQQRVKRLEEASVTTSNSPRNPASIPDLARATTPIATRQFSPFRTPRSHNELSKEGSSIGQDVGSGMPARSLHERLSAGHPLRIVEHISAVHPISDAKDGSYERFQPVELQKPSTTVNVDAGRMQMGTSLDTPAFSLSYTDEVQKSFDPRSDTANGTSPPEVAAQSTVQNAHSASVIEAGVGPGTSERDGERFAAQKLEDVEVTGFQLQHPFSQAPILANPQPQTQIRAPPALMVPNPHKTRQSPTHTPSTPATPATSGSNEYGATANDAYSKRRYTKRPKITNSDEAISRSGSEYTREYSLWTADTQPARSLSNEKRNEQGLLLRRNGKVDGRSMRYRPLEEQKRRHRPKQGPRDTEGYLLRSDGTRDIRSVRVIDSAKKKKAEVGQGLAPAAYSLP